jgi:hypothetical protein
VPPSTLTFSDAWYVFWLLVLLLAGLALLWWAGQIVLRARRQVQSDDGPGTLICPTCGQTFVAAADADRATKDRTFTLYTDHLAGHQVAGGLTRQGLPTHPVPTTMPSTEKEPL